MTDPKTIELPEVPYVKGYCKECIHWVKPKTPEQKQLAEVCYSHLYKTKWCNVHDCIMLAGNNCLQFEKPDEEE